MINLKYVPISSMNQSNNPNIDPNHKSTVVKFMHRQYLVRKRSYKKPGYFSEKKISS